MKNLSKSLILSSFLSLLFLYSCQKEKKIASELQKPLNYNSLTVQSVEKFTPNKEFIEKIDVTALEKNFGQLLIANAQITVFNERKDISYIMIPFANKEKFLYVYYLNEKNKILPFIFENNFVDKQNGSFLLKDIDDTIILEENYKDGKIIKIYSINSENTNSNGRVLKESECYKCITANYNAMKNSCESDPICDIYCDIVSPTCKLTFVTLALAACTSGNCGSTCPCDPF